MNELLVSLVASLQALMLLMSAQGMAPSAQMSSTLSSLQQTLQLQPQLSIDPKQVEHVREVVSFDTFNKRVMSSIVNILCTTRGGGTFNPISGSGVIIDARGVILTNAHVAQYILLQKLNNTTLQCAIRTGAPAKANYTAEVLFMPASWVEKHAKDIRKPSQLSTGEDDYALLLITGHTNDKKLGVPNFPALQFNLGNTTIVPNNLALLAGYPAGFLGGVIIQRNLWPVSTVGKVQRLMTFGSGSVDVLDLGGSIVAQQGVSGGAVVNKFGELVGLITTSSKAKTTDKRDLRAITISHINRSLRKYAGMPLDEFLTQNVTNVLKEFNNTKAPKLLEVYKKVLR